jgi:hypothetical protein
LGYDFVTTNDEYAAPTRWMAARKAIQQIAAALDGDEKKAAELVLALACDERLKAWAQYRDELRINSDGDEHPTSATNSEVPQSLWAICTTGQYFFDWKVNCFRGNGDHNEQGARLSIWLKLTGLKFLKDDLKVLEPRLKERKGGERPAIPTGRLRSWLETIPDRRTPTVEKIRTSAQAHFPKHSISKDRLTAALQELDGPRQKGGKKRLFAADIQAKLPSK